MSSRRNHVKDPEDQEVVVVVKAKRAWMSPLTSARNGVGDDSQPQRVNGTDICSSSI